MKNLNARYIIFALLLVVLFIIGASCSQAEIRQAIQNSDRIQYTDPITGQSVRETTITVEDFTLTCTERYIGFWTSEGCIGSDGRFYDPEQMTLHPTK